MSGIIGGAGSKSGVIQQWDTNWIQLTDFQQNWIEYSAYYPCRYMLQGQTVTIQGLVKNGSQAVAIILPVRIRPSKEIYFAQGNQNFGGYVRYDMYITPTGAMNYYADTNAGWRSLACTYNINSTGYEG
mgnify:CR=1 FL=1